MTTPSIGTPCRGLSLWLVLLVAACSRVGDTHDDDAVAPGTVWCIGRLQTDADRERVLESLKGPLGTDQADLADLLKRLAPRWFLMRDAYSDQGLSLLQPRWTMSYMRGPMTRAEIQKARDARLFSSTQRLTSSDR